MELVARLEAGERAADLAADAGVTAAAVSGWRRRLREEGALSLMTDSDIAARAYERVGSGRLFSVLLSSFCDEISCALACNSLLLASIWRSTESMPCLLYTSRCV